jgi:hypothetical protein
MTQKFFDNFFPKIEIGGMMGFDRGRHSDGDAGETATRIHVAGCGTACVALWQADRYALETSLLEMKDDFFV